MIRVIDLSTEAQRTIVDHRMALVTYMLPHASGFGLCIAIVTQRLVLKLNETEIGKFFIAHLAQEAFRMPVGIHRFDDTSNNEFTAPAAAGRKEHLEIMLAVLPSFKLVENPFRKRSEALGANKAMGMP